MPLLLSSWIAGQESHNSRGRLGPGFVFPAPAYNPWNIALAFAPLGKPDLQHLVPGRESAACRTVFSIVS